MYQPIVNQLEADLDNMAAPLRERLIKNVRETLAQIDAGTFLVTRTQNLSNPLRFWAEEYRYVFKKRGLIS